MIFLALLFYDSICLSQIKVDQNVTKLHSSHPNPPLCSAYQMFQPPLSPKCLAAQVLTIFHLPCFVILCSKSISCFSCAFCFSLLFLLHSLILFLLLLLFFLFLLLFLLLLLVLLLPLLMLSFPVCPIPRLRPPTGVCVGSTSSPSSPPPLWSSFTRSHPHLLFTSSPPLTPRTTLTSWGTTSEHGQRTGRRRCATTQRILSGLLVLESSEQGTIFLPQGSPFPRSGMLATIEAVWGGGEHVVFGAACYMHGHLTSSRWQTLQV